MKRTFIPILPAVAALAAALAFTPASTFAQSDGVVAIDQAKAEAGSVTPGDTPGFPIHITQPGSYRLTGNLTVTGPNANAIVIGADDVALDLNGFTIKGPITCTGYALSFVCNPANSWSVGVYSGNHNTVVRNGHVRGFGYGVSVAHDSVVEAMQVSWSARTGIRGGNSLIERNVVSHNVSGIDARGVIRDNVVTDAYSFGIYALETALVVGNRVHWTGGHGITAATVGGGFNAAVGNNIVRSASGQPIYGGISLGDGQSNLCESTKC